MTCKNCGEEIHPMHPTGYGTFEWAHDRDSTSLCVKEGKRTGTRAEPGE